MPSTTRITAATVCSWLRPEIRRHRPGPHAAGRHRWPRHRQGAAPTGNKTPILILSSALAEIDDGSRLARRRRRLSDQAVRLRRAAARLDALVRRAQSRVDVQRPCWSRDLQMDLLARKVTRGGKPIALQPREFKLLEYLMRHAGQVVTRTMLLEEVWDYHFDPQTNVIDMHISKLRQKIDAGFDHAVAAHRAGRRLPAGGGWLECCDRRRCGSRWAMPPSSSCPR